MELGKSVIVMGGAIKLVVLFPFLLLWTTRTIAGPFLLQWHSEIPRFSASDWDISRHRACSIKLLKRTLSLRTTFLLSITTTATARTTRASSALCQKLLHTIVLLDASAPLRLLRLRLPLTFDDYLRLLFPGSKWQRCRSGRLDCLLGDRDLYLIGARQRRRALWIRRSSTPGIPLRLLFDSGSGDVCCLTSRYFLARRLRLTCSLFRRLRRRFRSSRKRLLFDFLELAACLTLSECRA